MNPLLYTSALRRDFLRVELYAQNVSLDTPLDMRARFWVYLLTLLAAPNLVSACPRCEAGVLARRQVVEQDFTSNLLFATLPFVAVLVASMLSERIGRSRH